MKKKCPFTAEFFTLLFAITILLILTFVLFAYNAKAQSASWQGSTLFTNVTLNNASVNGIQGISTSSGCSIQFELTCVNCDIETKVEASLDQINFQPIPELTKNFTNTTTAVFNISDQFFRWYRFVVTERAGVDAVVSAISGTKTNL